MKTLVLTTSFLILVLLSITLQASDTLRTIAHQGILTSNDGTPVEDGMYSFSVSIYDSESSSDALWTETQTVGVINGVYNLMLGAVEPLDLPFDTHYWIGISVNSGDELNPRIPLNSVPYAFHAQSVPDGSITTAKLADDAVTQEKLHPDVSLPISGIAGGDLAGTYPDPEIADGAVMGSKIADGAVTSGKLSSNINITTTGTIEASSFKGDGSQLTNLLADEFTLPFEGEINSSGYALAISNTTGEGISGIGTGFGVEGRSSSANGIGVRGITTASSGHAYGVSGHTNSSDGRGVFARATASSGLTYGVYGQSDSDVGRGVFGIAAASSGLNNGVYGQSHSTSGRGVFGRATASSGATYGVRGESFSSAGYGVYGRASIGIGVVGESPTIGVWGTATRLTELSIGVQGSSSSTGGAGIWAVATATSGENYGIFARTQSSAGWAGYFDGRVRVTGNLSVGGNLSKGGGSFEIDHPQDPENMILRHSFVESPDMMNVYNGNVITDENSEAVVQLPEYFETLNRDFRYQLTVIGEFAQAIVAEEIQGNRFVIQTDNPNVKVSWQVTGIRKDPWAENHRIVVEEYKSPELRGYYLYPAVYGQPKTRSIEWGRNSEGMRQMEETIHRIENEHQNFEDQQIQFDEENELFILEHELQRAEPE